MDFWWFLVTSNILEYSGIKKPTSTDLEHHPATDLFDPAKCLLTSMWCCWSSVCFVGIAARGPGRKKSKLWGRPGKDLKNIPIHTTSIHFFSWSMNSDFHDKVQALSFSTLDHNGWPESPSGIIGALLVGLQWHHPGYVMKQTWLVWSGCLTNHH